MTGKFLENLRPLDRSALSRIPTVDGKFYIGGPYTFEEMLREPNWETEEPVDYRMVKFVETDQPNNSALIEIIEVAVSRKVTIRAHFPGKMTSETRYLFRRDSNLPIEGVATLHATYLLNGVLEKYVPTCKKVIHEVYVTPASRGQGIARILLAAIISDAPDVEVTPNFSADGARLFGFDSYGRRTIYPDHEVYV